MTFQKHFTSSGFFLTSLAMVILGSSCSETKLPSAQDAGLICEGNARVIRNGECVFICRRDADCAAEERCNLLTGTCEPKPKTPNPSTLCVTGATRCTSDFRSVETCEENGVWKTTETCPLPNGYCLNEKCLRCEPGKKFCDASSSARVNVCLDDGSGLRTVTCQPTATCTDGECRECNPGAQRCSADGKTVQTCQLSADETLSWKWKDAGDALNGSCITQVCQQTSASTAQCLPPTCFPGLTQCKNASTQQVCNSTGSWQDVVCSTLPGLGATAECSNGVCFDECSEAVKAKSYFGCEYWSAIQDNDVDNFFKGGVTAGQGTSDSDFAFVVTNRSLLPSTVTVKRWFGGAEVVVKTVSVPGRNDLATKGLAIIKVPWQSVGNDTTGLSVSGIARYGYKISSTRPITVYQFSPLDAVRLGPACSSANECLAAQNGVCKPPASGGSNVCHYFTYSNDASLLLPAHILGDSYVGMTTEHVKSKPLFGAESSFFNGHLTVVATQDGTTVSFRSAATTRSGTGVPAMSRGVTQTFTLNSYDVLQIASDLPPSHSSYACTTNPFSSLPGDVCRINNDLSGSIISSDKPIAVFGGSSCSLVPFASPACDHLEEQLFPFVTWGKNFVATRTAPLRMKSGGFATTSQAGPDYYKIVASCSPQDCPEGTEIKISPAPTSGEIVEPTYCQTNTSLAANNCRLLGGDYVTFSSKKSLVISANHPIAVGQFFAGQNATNGGFFDNPTQGDPSFVLLPPVEQWRSNYTLLTAPGISDNYVSIAVDDTQVSSVEVDGTPVALSSFSAIAGTNFKVKNQPLSVGTHTLSVVPKPGLSSVPGAGVTVYGFDSYVSYGYTGGLDLQTLVTGVKPGG